jgi:hypothetical protein
LIILKNNNKYIIELGIINNKIIFENELFLAFNSKDICYKNMTFLIQKRYNNYYYSSLNFKDDNFISLILDDNNKSKGVALK